MIQRSGKTGTRFRKVIGELTYQEFDILDCLCMYLCPISSTTVHSHTGQDRKFKSTIRRINEMKKRDMIRDVCLVHEINENNEEHLYIMPTDYGIVKYEEALQACEDQEVSN